jgi:hypothetical protein
MPDRLTYTRAAGPFQTASFIIDLRDEAYYANRKLDGDRKRYAEMVEKEGLYSIRTATAARSLASAEVWAEYAQRLLNDINKMHGPLVDTLRINLKHWRLCLGRELQRTEGNKLTASQMWGVIQQLEDFIAYIDAHGEEKHA